MVTQRIPDGLGTGARSAPDKRLFRRKRPSLAKPEGRRHENAMASLLSVLIGLAAIILAIPASLPFLGWANWMIVPLALVGAGVGVFARGSGARNFCLAVAALCMLRLWLGGGLI